MNRIKHLDVFCEDRHVGILAMTSTGMIAFQYTDAKELQKISLKK